MEQVRAYRSLNGDIYLDKTSAKRADKKFLINKYFINKMDFGSLERDFDNKNFKTGWDKLKFEIETVISKNIDMYFDAIKDTIPEKSTTEIKNKLSKKDAQSR